MRRMQARRGNGRWTRNTLENTFGLHCKVCPSCRSFNPWPVGQPEPTKCHHCQGELEPDRPVTAARGPQE